MCSRNSTNTLFERKPQFSLAIPKYYNDFLHDASESTNGFVGLDLDIGLAAKEEIKTYNKYYSFMDESDMYCTALVLDPRVKDNLILRNSESVIILVC
ncbi:hypothetical protein V1520DRAFT_344891 [Lipomyces starkeyi]